ncbi:ribonuclease domain-containing protein [Xanthomonas sp. MUS 060]|uniref:ribonuclease domain-containing protein n=1 Tax=Xanthomonas sp. MUS 060 TaxID=1588031 RepID=UPI0005F2EE41|nr:ribonuclease domain-containing protein [Xanthomonas sp. MUS 060]
MRKPVLLIAALVLLIGGLWGIRAVQQPPHPQFAPALGAAAQTPYAAPGSLPSTTPAATPAWPAFLPAEARATIALIQHGGPFAHRQDGSVFGNRDKRLPARPPGYYRAYTVDTANPSDRGTRWIVTGGDPPETWYYSDDHNASFRNVQVPVSGQTQ